MKFLLPALLVAALAFTAGGFAGRGQTAPPDPTGYDLDGDGYVTIRDLTILANHFLEPVAPPAPCVVTEHFVTPITSYDAAGQPYLVAGRGYVPTEHPLYPVVSSGTAVALRPCS